MKLGSGWEGLHVRWRKPAEVFRQVAYYRAGPGGQCEAVCYKSLTSGVREILGQGYHSLAR